MIRVALLAALLGAALLAPVAAQTLDRLTVSGFTLYADPAHLRVGDTLRLLMRVHFDQVVGEVDNVTLPNLSGFDVMGDERRCATVARGTDCSESLTVSPTVAGTRVIGPVTLDAIDARTNKPSRFATNTVTVVIDPVAAGPGVPSLLYDTMRMVLSVAVAALIVLVLIWGVGMRRRATPYKPPPIIPAPVAAPPPSPPPDADAPLRAAIDALRVDPTRARAFAVRMLLRRRADARVDETLESLSRRPLVTRDPRLGAALVAIERPAFIDDERVTVAAADALPALDALVPPLTPPPLDTSLEVAMPADVTWKPVPDGDPVAKSELPVSAFAFPSERKEPLIDAGHVRSALARFNQVEGVTDAEREQAFANIRAAAQHYGVHVTESSWHDFFKA